MKLTEGGGIGGQHRRPLPLSFMKSAKIRLAATCHLQTCHNLLKQLASSLWMASFGNQLAPSLSTTCNRLVVIKLSQAMRTHPDIGSLTKLLLVVVDLLQLARSCVEVWFGIK